MELIVLTFSKTHLDNHVFWRSEFPPTEFVVAVSVWPSRRCYVARHVRYFVQANWLGVCKNGTMQLCLKFHFNYFFLRLQKEKTCGRPWTERASLTIDDVYYPWHEEADFGVMCRVSWLPTGTSCNDKMHFSWISQGTQRTMQKDLPCAWSCSWQVVPNGECAQHESGVTSSIKANSALNCILRSYYDGKSEPSCVFRKFLANKCVLRSNQSGRYPMDTHSRIPCWQLQPESTFPWFCRPMDHRNHPEETQGKAW